MRRTTKKKPEIPERFIPIVDEVVNAVFARLRAAAGNAKGPTSKSRKGTGRTKKSDHPLVQRGRGLAEAVADLVLAQLTRPPTNVKKPVAKRTAAKRRSGR